MSVTFIFLAVSTFSKLNDYTYVPRKPRVILPGEPHHVTQRGGRRQDVFFLEEDREVYLDIMRHYTRKFEVEVLAYCLMTNHVHHMLVPPHQDALKQVMQPLNKLYAEKINARMEWKGHLWQERFYSAPVDHEYFWIAIRYIERNPVEKAIVTHASEYKWSSAASHCNFRADHLLSTSTKWQQLLATKFNWYQWLENKDDLTQIEKLRACTAQHLPCGTDAFLAPLEQATGKTLRPRPRGRPW